MSVPTSCSGWSLSLMWARMIPWWLLPSLRPYRPCWNVTQILAAQLVEDVKSSWSDCIKCSIAYFSLAYRERKLLQYYGNLGFTRLFMCALNALAYVTCTELPFSIVLVNVITTSRGWKTGSLSIRKDSFGEQAKYIMVMQTQQVEATLCFETWLVVTKEITVAASEVDYISELLLVLVIEFTYGYSVSIRDKQKSNYENKQCTAKDN